MNTLLAIGLGYSAKEIALRLKQDGWRIIGTARSENSLRAIQAMGCDAVPFEGEAASSALAEAMNEATHLLVSAAPGENGDPVLRCHSGDLAKAPYLKWIGYLSTIGVYGDHEGAWVDESTEPRPASQRSIWRLAAEDAWRAFADGRSIALQIFRLAGIYGPGRNQFEKLRAGREKRIYKPGQVFNRIHVADIASTVIAGIEAGSSATGVFNVTDDEPAPPQDVIAYAAGLLGMEPPPLVDWNEADMSPMARSFYSENKRVRNERIKRELGMTLSFPTYREGLKTLTEQ